MRFDWWSDKGASHCVNIIPMWPTTEIHLDRNGDIARDKVRQTASERRDIEVAGDNHEMLFAD
jgi:hypothetical protein